MDKLFERKMIINKILIPKYSNLEEIINSVSHGIGSILSIYGLVLLLVFNKWYDILSNVGNEHCSRYVLPLH